MYVFNYFELRPAVKEKKRFEDISVLALVAILLGRAKPLSNFGREPYYFKFARCHLKKKFTHNARRSKNDHKSSSLSTK